MNLSNKKNLQLATKIFFILSIFIIAFSIFDGFLTWYELVEITLEYSIVWLVILLITLVLLGISGKWKKFLLILFLGIGNVVFSMYVELSDSISQEKQIGNTDYYIEANMHEYRIKKENCCYRKVIATKETKIFFTPNTKIGFVPFKDIKLLSETPEMLILEIETSGYQSSRKVKDTIQKLKN